MADTYHTSPNALETTMLDMGKRARKASAQLAKTSPKQRTLGLRAMADAVEAVEANLLEANLADLEVGKAKGISSAMMDRLALTPARVASIADALRAVADRPDPVGTEITRWTVPSGLDIARVRTPLDNL